ncbi:hypothetical protein C4561_02340 [candidate division WWE3 bacterium]|jgi:hypothetical protein|uniref:Peptidase C39-like domain-containing protein n=1 Tax=candidate division WWE3 bacterium TaxID=2053526 RepID=A0A3A4ZDU2_UNCKA|nr:MAG: hypothetical protein C4561_02340 [candidate division WWE3 bacterium]
MKQGILVAFFIASTIYNSASISHEEKAVTSQPLHYLVNTDTNILLNVPYVHQVDDLPEDKKPQIMASACGPTAINMILKYIGEDIDLYSVIERLPDSVYIKGKMFYNLYEGPGYFGKETKRISKDPQAIYQALKDRNPIILNIQNYNGMIGHAVVIVGIRNFDGKTAESLIVHDPYVGPYREFKYINETTIKQPEGFNNYIGILDPFYVVNSD